MSEEEDIDMSWNSDKELAILISCIKSPIWIEGQEDFYIKCHIRELLQKCAGGKIVKMLKSVLTIEEKSALVRAELEPFIQSKAQSVKNLTKIRNEPDFSNDIKKKTRLRGTTGGAARESKPNKKKRKANSDLSDNEGGEPVEEEEEEQDYTPKAKSKKGAKKSADSSPAPTPQATNDETPSVEEVCENFGLNDVELDYSDADYQNLTTYKMFQQAYRSRIQSANPKVLYFLSTLSMLLF